jgi:hypothetical protein
VKFAVSRTQSYSKKIKPNNFVNITDEEAAIMVLPGDAGQYLRTQKYNLMANNHRVGCVKLKNTTNMRISLQFQRSAFDKYTKIISPNSILLLKDGEYQYLHDLPTGVFEDNDIIPCVQESVIEARNLELPPVLVTSDPVVAEIQPEPIEIQAALIEPLPEPIIQSPVVQELPKPLPAPVTEAPLQIMLISDVAPLNVSQMPVVLGAEIKVPSSMMAPVIPEIVNPEVLSSRTPEIMEPLKKININIVPAVPGAATVLLAEKPKRNYRDTLKSAQEAAIEKAFSTEDKPEIAPLRRAFAEARNEKKKKKEPAEKYDAAAELKKLKKIEEEEDLKEMKRAFRRLEEIEKSNPYL